MVIIQKPGETRVQEKRNPAVVSYAAGLQIHKIKSNDGHLLFRMESASISASFKLKSQVAALIQVYPETLSFSRFCARSEQYQHFASFP
jgi:hypothetical protein